ncbi:MAG TPA: hypothetical protein VFI42_01220 [Thermomicrobiaceae bacterium]|nr:hypothetical protein [Thermomicrobiaceae bacterium]
MKRYVATFYRHWWLYLPILILLLAGTAVGTNAVVRKAAKYQSTTRIWVSEPPLQQALGQTQSYQQRTPAQARNDMLYQLIQTDSFIRNILTGTPTAGQLNGDLDHDQPTILKVRAGIRIQVLGANSVLISYEDASPEIAQSVLQNIVNEFRNWLLASNLEQASAEKTYYEDQATSYQQQVDQARQNLDAFTAQHPSITPDDLTAQAQLQRLQSVLQAAEQTYNVAQSKLQEAEVINSLSSASTDGSTFRILDTPTRPGNPASVLKKAIKYSGLGVGGSFAFVLAAIFILTWTDKNVWTSEELKACCQFPVLEVVPHLKRRTERPNEPAAQQKSGSPSEAPIPSASTG